MLCKFPFPDRSVSSAKKQLKEPIGWSGFSLWDPKPDHLSVICYHLPVILKLDLFLIEHRSRSTQRKHPTSLDSLSGAFFFDSLHSLGQKLSTFCSLLLSFLSALFLQSKGWCLCLRTRGNAESWVLWSQPSYLLCLMLPNNILGASLTTEMLSLLVSSSEPQLMRHRSLSVQGYPSLLFKTMTKLKPLSLAPTVHPWTYLHCIAPVQFSLVYNRDTLDWIPGECAVGQDPDSWENPVCHSQH